jgi:polyisoprenoid-binding protein YceI
MRRILALIASVSIALATSDVVAQGPAAAGQPPVPGDVDLATSRVYVLVGKTGLGHDHAVIGKLVSGSVRLDAGENAGQIVFDMRSFLADTPEARKVLGLAGQTDESTRRQTTDNMLGPDVLDVDRHPTATFDIGSALRSARPGAGAKPTVDLAGSFTLHGVTRKVVIPVEVESVGPILRLTGSFRIKQSDFGMKPYKKFGGVVGVADELSIHGDIRIAAASAGNPNSAGQPATIPSARPPAGPVPPERPAPAVTGGRK